MGKSGFVSWHQRRIETIKKVRKNEKNKEKMEIYMAFRRNTSCQICINHSCWI